MQTPTASELYNSILRKMREEGRSEEDIRLVAEYLTGNKINDAKNEHEATIALREWWRK